MGTPLAKMLLWCALVVGVACAAAAVYFLHVYGVVGALIVASVAGLVLLWLRPEARSEQDSPSEPVSSRL